MALEKCFSFYFQTTVNLAFCKMEWKLPESFFPSWKKSQYFGEFSCSMHAGAFHYAEIQNFHCCWKWSQHKVFKCFSAVKTVPFKWESCLQRCCRMFTCIQFYDWSWLWEDLGVTVKCFVGILNLIFKLQCLKWFQAITFTHKLLNCEQQYIQAVISRQAIVLAGWVMIIFHIIFGKIRQRYFT